MFLGVLTNAFSSVLGRNVNRQAKLEPIVITVISMGFDSIILFIVSLIVEGLPEFKLNFNYLYNLAGRFQILLLLSIYGLTLRNLTAIEPSKINGTMLIQIAILAWIFLDENLTFVKILGMTITSFGAFLVQLKKRF